MLRSCALLCIPGLLAAAPCRIEIFERGTDWPVPGVELRTVHGVRMVSDNAGRIAFDLPECMGRETWTAVHGHGYGVQKDGFGFAGVRFVPRPGETVRLEVDRALPGRRIGRLTGAGLFAESQKLGMELDWRESGVLGSDSVVNAEFGGLLYWFWGDTNLAHYPLGFFNVAGATTRGFVLPDRPPVRPPYAYFTAASGAAGESRPRGVAEVPGDGPTWLWGAVSLPDAAGVPHLVGAAVKVKGVLQAYRWDLVEWDAAASMFRPIRTVWRENGSPPPPLPDGYAVRWRDPAGKDWVLFCNPFPHLRCLATYEAWRDPATWEALEAPRTAARAEGGEVVVHRGHMAWHAWSGRWLAVFTEKGGNPSPLGEVWLAEASSPEGPWVGARKVATHDQYTFYNPVLHPESFRPDSPIVHFEGTYVTTFTNNQQPTPRWEYNQVLYQVDLSQPPFVPAQ